jgi:DNA polymerase elongation subunit (family B)
MDPAARDEWLWGWDPTPGIVSVWAEPDGSAHVWRRIPETGALVHERTRYRPWILLDRLDDLTHLGSAFGREGARGARVTYRELEGPGRLRFLVSAPDTRQLVPAVLEGASRRLGKRYSRLRELEDTSFLSLPPDEQYLVATGRNYFRDLAFDQLVRLQFDLETTGLDPERDRIFLIAVRDPGGATMVLEAAGSSDRAEAELIGRLVETIRAADPDVIENHNLHGFDLPFLERRARLLREPLRLGRLGAAGLRQRPAARGALAEDDPERRVRFVAPGRELIDTLDAVRRYDFSIRELPGHGLKAVARHLGIARPDREYVPGHEIHRVFRTDPDRVRRYAADDVTEVAHLARMMGGAAFALARMAPRRYERLADAGPATGVIDPLLVRAYLRSGVALPAHEPGDGTEHTGAGLYLFAAGVAHRVVKADVASLYPSLMRVHRIGPARDRLGVLLALVDQLVEQRLAAKARARAAPPGSAERHGHEAISAAMKLVVNSAYGYLAAGGELTRFADVHAANEVTRRGRETLELICRALADRGVTLLEADTDGVYFAVPPSWTSEDERVAVTEVAALLPSLIHLELEGRYAAMLSHEPKNYALLSYDGRLTLRGVAFRSSRAEPFGEAFLRRAIGRLLEDDVPGVRAAFVDAVTALRRRELSTYEVSSKVRLTKTPEEYRAGREERRELPYEALLAAGRTSWRVGERIRVYRTAAGTGGLVEEDEDDPSGADPRDYDVEHYVRLLEANFAARLARAFTPEDFLALVSDPDQPSLFTPDFESIRSILSPVERLPASETSAAPASSS